MRLDPTVTTLAEFFGEFRALVEDGLTSNARQSYARAWTRRVEPTLGALPLAEIRPLTIARAKATWSGAESTKGDALALLSKVLGLAVMDGLLPANPCRSLPRTRGKAHESEWTSRALDDLQVRRMLALASFHPFGQRALAGLAFTGLRLGELVGLRWEDLNEAQGYLTVRRTFSPDGHGRLEERPTKSGKSRQVPIIEELNPWLDAARELGHDHVFTGKLGGPFDSGNLARALGGAQSETKSRRSRTANPSGFTICATRSCRASHGTASHPRTFRRSLATRPSRRPSATHIYPAPKLRWLSATR